MDTLTSDRITSIIRSIVETGGCIPVETVIRGHAGSRVIEVYVDAESGVTTEVCARLSRAITERLDAEGLLAEGYTLTVSSPGIDRPLRDLRQFGKHAGRKLSLTLTGSAGGGRIDGILTGTGPGTVRILTEGESEERVIEFHDIAEATVRPPW